MRLLEFFGITEAHAGAKWLYHATSMSSMDSIAYDGLDPSVGGSNDQWGQAAVVNSKDRIFFSTSPRIASRWYDYTQEAMFHGNDSEHAHHVIMIRIPGSLVDTTADDLGNNETHPMGAMSDSVFITVPVGPEYIQYFDGKDWHAVADYEDLEHLEDPTWDQDYNPFGSVPGRDALDEIEGIQEAHNPKVRVKYMPRNDAYYAYLGRTRVGQATLYNYRDEKVGEDERYIWKSAVHDDYKRQGVATAMYDAIAKDLESKGLKLVPSPGNQLSGEAYQFWKARDLESVKGHGQYLSEPYQKYEGQEITKDNRPMVIVKAQYSASGTPFFQARYTDVPEGSVNSVSSVNFDAVKDQLTEADVGKRIRSAGIDGFSGNCFQAAININNEFFGGKGDYVLAYNKAFMKRGQLYGHAAVLYDGVYWDADGTAKSVHDIESWGMMDEDDPDLEEQAEELGFVWDENAAYDVAVEIVDEQTLRQYCSITEATKHGKEVVWDNGQFFIAVNNPNKPTFFTAWTQDNEKVGTLSTKVMNKGGEPWMAVDYVEVDKGYKRQGIARAMYSVMLQGMSSEFAGLFGYGPDIASKHVAKIYQRYGAYEQEDGHFYIPNPNRQVSESLPGWASSSVATSAFGSLHRVGRFEPRPRKEKKVVATEPEKEKVDVKTPASLAAFMNKKKGTRYLQGNKPKQRIRRGFKKHEIT